jgi:chemosensory pili system protein ChpC
MYQKIADASAPKELSTLLIPVKGSHLILPNVTIAEIISRVQVAGVDDVPNWFVGFIQWRKREVPIVLFEAINDQPFAAAQNQQKHIAIVNGGNAKTPFWGLLTEATPRSIRLTKDQIIASKAVIAGPAELQRVSANETAAIIPDLNYIEDKIVALMAELKAQTG